MKNFTKLGEIINLDILKEQMIINASKSYANYMAYHTQEDFDNMVESFKRIGSVRTDHRGMCAILNNPLPGVKSKKLEHGAQMVVVHKK